MVWMPKLSYFLTFCSSVWCCFWGYPNSSALYSGLVWTWMRNIMTLILVCVYRLLVSGWSNKCICPVAYWCRVNFDIVFVMHIFLSQVLKCMNPCKNSYRKIMRYRFVIFWLFIAVAAVCYCFVDVIQSFSIPILFLWAMISYFIRSRYILLLRNITLWVMRFAMQMYQQLWFQRLSYVTEAIVETRYRDPRISTAERYMLGSGLLQGCKPL